MKTAARTAAALVALSCAGLDAGARQDPAPPPALDLRPTTLKTSSGGSYDADIGSLQVVENRDVPTGRTIALKFVRVRSRAASPAAPLVYLAGGPGGAATPRALSPRALDGFSPLLEICDLIFLDQRGTGHSEPNMRVLPEGDLHDVLFLDYGAALQRLLDVSRRAAATLRERGIDLAAYTTVQSADDVDDLRQALGLDHISLLGFSYGTHLGQAIMKRHGEHVERAVLCGVEGLDETYKLPEFADVQLAKIAMLVRDDPVVGPECPDLTALLQRVLAKLEREPMRVTLARPSGARYDVPVGPFGLLLILRMDLGDASDITVFPRLLHSIEEGDPSVLRWFVQKRLSMFSTVSGMSFIMDGASGATEARRALIREQAKTSLFGEVVNFPNPVVAAAWDPPDLGDDFRSPLISDVPTLLLSGTLDWNTPPFQAERLRFGLTDAHHIIVANAGHEQILRQPEVRRAVATFLRGEPVPVAAVHLPPPRFVPLTGHDPDATHPSVTDAPDS